MYQTYFYSSNDIYWIGESWLLLLCRVSPLFLMKSSDGLSLAWQGSCLLLLLPSTSETTLDLLVKVGSWLWLASSCCSWLSLWYLDSTCSPYRCKDECVFTLHEPLLWIVHEGRFSSTWNGIQYFLYSFIFGNLESYCSGKHLLFDWSKCEYKVQRHYQYLLRRM